VTSREGASMNDEKGEGVHLPLFGSQRVAPVAPQNSVPMRIRGTKAIQTVLAFLLPPALLGLVGCTDPGPLDCSSFVSPVTDRPAEERFIVAVDATADQERLHLPPVLVDEMRAAALDHLFSLGVIQGRGDAEAFWLHDGVDVGLTKPPRNVDNRNYQAGAAARCLADRLETATAREPGTDVLAALHAIDRMIPDPPPIAGGGAYVPPSGATKVAVVTNGLSNAGVLDLRKVISQDVTAQWVVRELSARGELPKLRGAEVRFYYLGNVAKGGPILSAARRAWLRELWLGVCRASHATSCEAVDKVGAGDDRKRLAPPDWPFPALASPEPIVPPATPRKTIPTELLFKPGAAYLVPGAASRLQPVAECLLAAGASARIEGHTASWGTPAYRDNLSRRRAQAVVKRLVALGVPASKLTARGWGSRHRKENDLGPDGRLIEPQASHNRRIEIISSAMKRCS
jgi:outer membrane protein OmpA-like peptidoglycan-associated protein